MSCALLVPVVLSLIQAPTGTPAAAKAPAETPRATERTMVGQILSVDLEKRVILIGESMQSSSPKTAPKTRETLSLVVDETTKLFRGVKPASLEELKPKDHAVVHYLVTPSGAKAVSCRVAELARTPVPTSPSGTPGSAAAQAQ